MYKKPSIVLEGAPRAADWIPYATGLLSHLTHDGTSTYSPEDGITVIISRHGGLDKILINADYEEGSYFVGEPYDEEHILGWGFPDGYTDSEADFKGIDQSKVRRAVRFNKEFDATEWDAERYPEYKIDYKDEIRCGNLDWTSNDGLTVLTWDGIYTLSNSSVPNITHALFSADCCGEVPPADNWYVGYPYPGMILTDGQQCTGGQTYGPYISTGMDDGANTFNADEHPFSDRIYQGGEVLTKVRSYFEVDGTVNMLAVMGASVHYVTNADTGEEVKYIAAVVGRFNIYYGLVQEELYVAKYSDLDDFKVIDLGLGTYFEESYSYHNNLNAWVFDSTGKKAVVVRFYHGAGATYKGRVVHELTINDDHTVSISELWTEEVNGALIKHNYVPTGYYVGQPPSVMDAEGVTIIAVGYDKKDVVRYAVNGGTAVGTDWIENYSNGTCNVAAVHNETTINYSMGFTYNPLALQNTITTEANYFNSVLSEVKEPSPPFWLTETLITSNAIPIYVNCKLDMVIVQKSIIDKFTLATKQTVAPPVLYPELMDPLSAPYRNMHFLEIWIEGKAVYATAPVAQYRYPGDCVYLENDYYGDTPTECFDVANHIEVADANGVIIGDVTHRGDLVFSFAQVQTSLDANGFDMMVSARTRYDGEVICFLARWDGAELINIQHVDNLLGLQTNGFLAKTGKL